MAKYRHDPKARWFAAVRGGVILVVPAEAGSELSALWPSLCDGDPTSDVLDRLTAKGLAATPSFALVVRDEAVGSVRVVVRGPIAVRVGEAEIHDAGVSTWVERVIADAAKAEVEVAVDGHGGAEFSDAVLPVVEAVVPARSVTSGRVEPVAPAGAVAPKPAAKPAATAVVAAEQTMVPAEETIAMVATPARIAAPAGLATPAAEGDLDGDHDGMTIASIDIHRLREQRAARAAAAKSGGGAPVASVVQEQISIRMPDGSLEPIGHEVVLGRAPSVSKVSGGRIPRLVTIGLGDPDISRSHVRLALEGDTVVITDLHSRNGTHVAQPGKAPVKLRAGEPTPALTGSVVDLGGGWTVQVVGG